MARLPQPGGDDNQWGDILNTFLRAEHNDDGTLKIRSDGTVYTKPAAGIPSSDLTTAVQTSLTAANTAVQRAGDTMTGALNVPGGKVVPSGWYNVRTYGAVGDGTADDTAAIQAAINAVPASGGTLYLPTGNYRLTAALELKSFLVLQGDGVNATRLVQSNPVAHGLHAVDVSYVDIRDLRVGGPASGSGIGIYLTHASTLSVNYVNLTNVNIRQFGSHGLQIDTVVVTTLLQVVAQNNGGHGFYISDGTSVNFQSCYGLTNALAGYYLYSTDYSSLSGCATDKCGTGYVLDSCQGTSLQGCGCESTSNNSPSYPGHAFKVTGGSNNGLYNCWNYANANVSYLVTGNSVNNTLNGVSESGPTVSATASIQIDSGSAAALLGYQVVTALNITGKALYWDGTNNRFGVGLAPTHAIEAAGSGSSAIGKFTSNTGSGTNTQPVVQAIGVDSGNRAFGASTGADTNLRWTVGVDGRQEWGTGSASRDTFLQRTASGTLATTNIFAAGTGLQVGATTSDFGGGVGVVSIKNAPALPTSNPSGGVIAYADSGILKWRDPNGVVYDLSTTGSGTTSALTTPEDIGYKTWNYDPISAANTLAPTAGVLYLLRVQVRKSDTLAKAWFAIASTAGMALTTGNYLGLYNSSGALVASTNDLTSSITSSGEQSYTFTSAASVTAGFYWVGLLFNGTTLPTLVRASGVVTGLSNGPTTTATKRFAQYGSSQTALPANLTLTSLTNVTSNTYWVAVS